MENVKLGKNVTIHKGAVVGLPLNKGDEKLATEIGDNTEIFPFSIIHAGAKLGSNCRILSSSVVYPKTEIGDKFFAANGAVIRENVKIGDNCAVGNSSVVLPGTVMKNDVKIHSFVLVAENTKFDVGAWIGPSVTMHNTKYPKAQGCGDRKKQCDVDGGPVIGKNVIIGGNATINPYTKIGDGAIIGAASVITKDVPEDAVAVGSPAKVVANREDLKCRCKEGVSAYGKN